MTMPYGRALRHLLVLALGAVLMTAGCGSDGGDSSGGNNFAGIEGTGIVTGFGSIYVDGIEFATGDTQISFEGNPASEDRLRVGDVVDVRGRIDPDGNARADRIVFDRRLRGPVERIETRAGKGELSALEQTIRFDENTTFARTSAKDLAPGALITVSGFADGDGVLRATSIEKGAAYEPGVTSVDLEGEVRDLEPGRFRLGALQVDYAAADVDTTAGELADGSVVEVSGVRAASAQAPLVAGSVQVRARVVGAEGEQVFLDGVIENFDSLAAFRLAGQTVDASGAQRRDDAPIDPASGVRVRVRGTRQNDTLIADSYSVQPPPTVTLQGRLSELQASDNALVVLGSRWQARPDTIYLDRSDANDRQLRADRMAPGDSLKVSGYEGANGLVGTRLERIVADATGTSVARGPLDRISRRGDTATLDIAGVIIVTRTGTTTFINAQRETIDADRFFAQAAPGIRIEATGPNNGGRIDTAREVQLLD